MRKVLSFTVVLLFFSCFAVLSQNNNISREEAIKDIDTLVSSIDEIHLNMFYAYPKEKFFNELSQIKSELPDSLSPLDLYTSIVPLIAKLEDGHTDIYMPYHAFSDESLLIPLAVDVNQNDSTLNVILDYENEGDTIPKGAKIININNTGYKEIVEKMLAYCSGERIFFRLSKVARMFRPLLYINYPAEIYNIEYVYNNETYTKAVKAQPKSKRIYTNNTPMQSFEPYSFSIDEKTNTGIIDFKSFMDKQKFVSFTDSVFTVIKDKGIPNLIIDLRKNGGGDSSLGDELFQYISDVPFNQFSKVIKKVSPLYRKLSGDNSSADSIYIYDSFEPYPLRDNPLRFTGNTYVLVSHMTFSSAASFSWTFQKLGMGKVIGEETGGMAVCYGDVIVMNLPHSQLQVQISLAKIYEYGANENDVHGTLPDIEVPEAEALEYTLRLIEESTKNTNK